MKKKLRNNVFNWVLLSFSTIFCFGFSLQAHQNNQITVTFDSLFPPTWYQKGLEAVIYVWHTLADGCKSNKVLDRRDSVLAKLAFAQFYINHMLQDGAGCLPDDKAYLGAVLNKIKELIGLVNEDEEFVECVGEMVEGMLLKI